MADGTEPNKFDKKLKLEVFDKNGKSLEVVKEVEVYTKGDPAKDTSISWHAKTKTLAGNKVNPGDKLTDAQGTVWVVKSASTVGQGEIWIIKCEKKNP
ncbi:hypothetical protein VT84_12085 [Gemmata sp. SH-PL17]|uniref:hypothetical protein n=1 Tax=Gemmata sp. SH-PL17 TaxID=1630693 RepID=UPI00078CC198|nr:hypothetical protein [Gemmata sp. SH-PL17]AMV25128.1 hypothetical protein VT84_12085 [Gemmata sp. SH-PL17]